MELLFARHGNTFGPDDKVVWVGRETDLPLVESGRLQAQAVARRLAAGDLRPDAIYCATLMRTRQFAAIVAEHLGMAPAIQDSRLDELDYGDWAGRSNEEIRALGPDAERAMALWNEADVWPEGAGWRSRPEEMLSGITAFLRDRIEPGYARRPLIVSSNGVLRFFPRVLQAVPTTLRSYKMGTGRLGVIVRAADGFQMSRWNEAPDQL